MLTLTCYTRILCGVVGYMVAKEADGTPRGLILSVVDIFTGNYDERDLLSLIEPPKGHVSA